MSLQIPPEYIKDPDTPRRLAELPETAKLTALRPDGERGATVCCTDKGGSGGNALTGSRGRAPGRRGRRRQPGKHEPS